MFDTLHTCSPLALGLAFFLVAALYAAVGHGGASAYLAVMGLLGLAIGFLSGLIGIGGGIFLTSLLILWRWSPAKPAAAISAAFIFANSLAGLTGFLATGRAIPAFAWSMHPAVLAGGWLGARRGSQRAGSPALLRALAAVLVVAAAKFVIP